MKNINYYNDYATYTGDTNRPTTESTVSSVGDGTGVIFAGKNILVEKSGANIGDILVFVKTTNSLKFIKYGTYYAAGLPASVTTIGVVYKRDEKNVYIVSKSDAGSYRWAQGYKVKLTGFDLATGGDFTITVNSTTTANINYTTSDTLSTIVTKINSAINAGAADSALKNWTVATASNYITIEHNWYTPAMTTVSVTDASLKISATILTSIDYQKTNTNLLTRYGSAYRNDMGSTSNAGANFDQYKAYYSVSGSDTTGNTVGSTVTIRQSRFNSTDNPLLTSYYSSYDAYLQDKMAKQPYSKGAIIDKNGKTNTTMLSTVTFTDADGSTKPAYPAAYYALNTTVGTVSGYTTGLEAGNWFLPSFSEFYDLMKGIKLNYTDKVSVSLIAISGTGGRVLPTDYYWTSTEFSSNPSWTYSGYYGLLYTYGKNLSLRVRPFAAFSL